MKDMKAKNQEKIISKSLDSNSSKSVSAWERRKLYSKQMYQKRRVSKDSELKEIQIYNPNNKLPKQEKVEEKFEKNLKIQKRKFSLASKEKNENNKENITIAEENDCPVPKKLQRRESFIVCKGISPMIMKNKQMKLTEELIVETDRNDFAHFENETSELNCNISCTNIPKDENEIVSKNQKLANKISKNKANNPKIEKCNQKSDLFKHPPKPGSGATSSLNILNNNQNKKETSFIITEKKLSRKEQLIKWRQEQEERKCNLQKRRTICPIISENSCLNDKTSLLNMKETEKNKSAKSNNNLKITDFKEKGNKILKNKDSIAITKEKRFTLASNDLQKIEAARKRNYKNFNNRQSIVATKEKRFTMTRSDLQKIENLKRTKCDEIKKSRQSIAVTKERRVTIPNSHLHKIENIKRKTDDKLMPGRKSIAAIHKTSITVNNALKNKKVPLTKIKNSAELQCKQIPSNGKIKSSALSNKEDIKKKESNIITTANMNQTRRSISSLFRAGQLEKAKNKKNVSICFENKLPENEIPKSIIKGKSSRKKSVCFNVTSDIGTSGRKLPKTPKRQLTMRESLESWLDNEGHSLSDFHHILCFGHHFSDVKLKKFSKVKFDNHPDSLGGSPLLKVRNSSDKNDLSVSDTYDVDKVILELKKLLQIDYPSSKVTEWLHDIAKYIPEIEKEPQYWICHSLAAEKENKLEEALSFYHTALDKGVEAAEISQEFERLLCNYSAQNENKWQSQKVAKISDKTKVNTPRKPLVDNGNIFQSTMIMYDLSLTGSKHYKSPAKVVATPVRRSARLCRTPGSAKEKSLCIENINELSYDLRNHMLLKENNALPEL